MAASTAHSSPPPAVVKSDFRPGVFDESPANLRILEEQIEKAIYGCRFLTLLAVSGSLVGSLLCFVKVAANEKKKDDKGEEAEGDQNVEIIAM
ncbi:uncharacterized protein LOC143863654 isoform X2 [Tasmannia lanceolata]|uniref:uncharacterized protein LOC143863654 isoform X2 n=1 Tax=Tasmannia lanceolata TaxID=3420 RepID=UPI00406302DD